MNTPTGQLESTASARFEEFIVAVCSRSKAKDTIERFFREPLAAFVRTEAPYLDTDRPELPSESAGGSKTRLCATLVQISRDVDATYPGAWLDAPGYVFNVVQSILGQFFEQYRKQQYLRLLRLVSITDILPERVVARATDALDQ